MKMPRILITIMTALVLSLGSGGLALAQSGSSGDGKPKILIAYFSRTGNTETTAKQIQDRVGGDLFQVVTVDAYPAEYRATTEVARKELDSNYRPPLRGKVDNMDSYDVVFLGFPNWWATMPMAMFTFLESYDFSGKTIIPFCTHEGSGLGRSVDDLKKLAPKSTIREGLAIRGSRVSGAQNDVNNWLERVGFN